MARRTKSRCGIRAALIAPSLLAVSVLLPPISYVGAEALATAPGSPTEANLPPPDQFVRETLQHEVQAQLQDRAVWCFQETKLDAGKHKTFRVCQTSNGNIERLIAIDGRRLSPQESHQEDSRIQGLLKDAGEVKAQQKKDREDGEQARRLLKMFPDAFQYRYDGRVGKLVRLKFVPNPNFHPSGHTALVFHHMEGTMLLDPDQKRLAGVDGTLTSEVKFGAGLLGHLDKGGTFAVIQQNVGSNYWEVTSMNVRMTGKALFFKNIGVRTEEKYSDFHPAPDGITLQQAAELVRQQSTSAANFQSGGN
jgi:hypothetical protein